MPGPSGRIVLATINARHAHCAHGLRCLKAALGELADACEILELDTGLTPVQAVELILMHRPQVVGLSVYLWNVDRIVTVMRLLRQLAPEVRVITGGPQIQPGREHADEVRLADVAIAGEGELEFAAQCRAVSSRWPARGTLVHALPVQHIPLPDSLYSDHDCRRRVVYLESSRGCPFHCTYCVSCGDAPVRLVPVDAVLASVDRLLQRGVQMFRFLDRSFNALGQHAVALLDGLYPRWRPGIQWHFECVPHCFPAPLRASMRRFEQDALHLEVGVQTCRPATAAVVGRVFAPGTVEAGLRFLAEETRAALHIDLIAGLPGEDMESFCDGVDRLAAQGAAELQLGLLKGLPGTPLRQNPPAGMEFSVAAPFEVVKTDVLSFQEVRRLARMGHVWRLLQERYGYGDQLCQLARDGRSPGRLVLATADALMAEYGRCHALGRDRVLAAWDAR